MTSARGPAESPSIEELELLFSLPSHRGSERPAARARRRAREWASAIAFLAGMAALAACLVSSALGAPAAVGLVLCAAACLLIPHALATAKANARSQPSSP